jgi:hypothetical protein
MQFTILACFKNLLQDQFDKLNKKCEKYGNEQLSFVVLRAFEENNKEKLEIEVSGCTPKIGDYELISVISQLPDGTNIVNNVPGKETPVEFRESTFERCDHCNENRYRKEVVIVCGPDGYKQLGKTCLKDYLGISLENLVNKFSRLCELIQEYNDEEYYPREELVCSPQFYLERVSVCCRKLGYVSSKAAYDDAGIIATKQTAWNVTFPDSFTYKFIAEKELYVEDQDKELVVKAMEWARNLEGKNDFELNILALVKQDTISYKYCGYIAAIIPCYQKALSIELEKNNTTQSEFIGEPKQRLDIAAKCVFKKEFESDYGLKTILKFNSNGNILVWFASGKVDFNMGEDYLIKATIKEHQVYNNSKQTVVNRVKMIAEKV